LKVSFKTFTLSNTGLLKASEFPELGSVFKAAFMKTALHFFVVKSLAVAEEFPDESFFGI